MKGCYQVLIPLLSLFLHRELFTGIYPLKFPVEILKVLDGDTVEVRVLGKIERIRLSGIDAPEKGQPSRLGLLDAGLWSRNCLKRILKDSDWELEWKGRDIYQRVLGDLTFENKSAAHEMLKQGCASVYPFFSGVPNRERSERLLTLTIAKHSKIGLWAYGGFMRPYHWRKSQKTKRTPVATE